MNVSSLDISVIIEDNIAETAGNSIYTEDSRIWHEAWWANDTGGGGQDSKK